jgi:hypothetical protein
MASADKTKRSVAENASKWPAIKVVDMAGVTKYKQEVRPVSDNVQVADEPKVEPKVESKVEQPQVVEESKGTKSDLFRRLYDEGMDIPTIAHTTGSNYSFVRAVVTKYAKDKGQPITSRIKGEKADLFRKMWDAGGVTIGRIATITGSNYSYVHIVISKHRRDQAAAAAAQTKVVA